MLGDIAIWLTHTAAETKHVNHIMCSEKEKEIMSETFRTLVAIFHIGYSD